MPLSLGPSALGRYGVGRRSCTADQKLERCAVAKNRAQEVREGPRLASARLAETVSKSVRESPSGHDVLSSPVEVGTLEEREPNQRQIQHAGTALEIGPAYGRLQTAAVISER